MSNSIFWGILLAEDQVRFHSNCLCMNLGDQVFTMASRQAQLCAAIMHMSSLFLGHPTTPPLEVNGKDIVGSIHRSSLRLPSCTQ